MRFLLLTLAFAPLVAAQSFEVVSIKPNNSNSGRSSERTNAGRVMAENITVSSMAQQAFGVKAFQISGGPGWMSTDSYDLNATTGTSKDLDDRELQPYWQALLTERFGMKYHRESKEMPVYSLVPAKGGAKLTAHPDTGNTSTGISSGSGKVSLSSTNISMPKFAELLARRMDRLVINNTGLDGIYDVKLEWAPDPSADTTIASLFSALRDQLGLKLESTRGPVEIIVIDSLERPSEN